MNYNSLRVFEGLKLENMTTKNRIVRSATHSMLGNIDGTISDEELKMFNELAKNDIGLIIVGQFFVNRESIVAPGSNELSEDRHISSAAKIMDVVKPYDTKVIAQLNHAGSKAYNPHPIAPSSMTLADSRNAKEMTLDEIVQIKNDFSSAALRAKRAGFNGVQLHAAHGYLLCEFMKPSVNKREDMYGGSAENRFRFIGEIIQDIKSLCGSNFPVFIKIDVNDLEEMKQYKEDLKTIMPLLKEYGIEAVEFSSSEFGIKKYKDHNYFMDRALELMKGNDLKTMLVGGIRHFGDMEAVMDAGIDMVSISRPLISEPDLITRLKNGQETSRCVSCNKCPEAGRKRCIFVKLAS